MFAPLSGALVLVPSGGAGAGPPAAPETAVTGTLSGGALTGTLAVEHFGGGAGGLRALGTLRATLTGAAGRLGTVRSVPVEVPVTAIRGTPRGLRLELGPVHLDLLGFMVHLNGAALDLPAGAGRRGPPEAAAGLAGGGAPAAAAQRLNRLLGWAR
jgi:hypothetical protein